MLGQVARGGVVNVGYKAAWHVVENISARQLEQCTVGGFGVQSGVVRQYSFVEIHVVGETAGVIAQEGGERSLGVVAHIHAV